MFTGIIEELGQVEKIEKEQSNLHLWINSPFTNELKIDQSISHNGVCLTVVELNENLYKVTAIDETLRKTNLGDLKKGDKVNLERCLKLGDRLDGHIVQGHVDQIGKVKSIENKNGSTLFTISYDEKSSGNITVEKGSVSLNGISLTVVNSKEGEFSVAIIPYTMEHTNLHALKINDKVNLEFDLLGKYIRGLMAKQNV